MKNQIQKFDYAVLGFLKKYNILFARAAIFVVYFWFGILKLLDLSPAQPLVQSLLEKTLPFISFQNFIVLFALFEMLIGVLFLIRGAERIVMVLLVLHLITTCLPLFLLPQITWQGFLTPTLEGQYIIKNILIIALAFVVAAQMEFLGEKSR
ncbi:MAG TPA: hypothetical protein VE973_02005 [Candidatus Limnocylindria bacterium]|nr:hypothetical protein [Candidatus Limnocylindria bacterium]